MRRVAIRSVTWLTLWAFLLLRPDGSRAGSYRRILFVSGIGQTRPEQRALVLLRERLTERATSVDITWKAEDSSYSPTAYDLVIMAGSAARQNAGRSLLIDKGILVPTAEDPGKEGFVMKLVTHEGRPTLLVIGTDSRGMLFGIGRFLFSITYTTQISFGAEEVDLRAAPEKKFRAVGVEDI